MLSWLAWVASHSISFGCLSRRFASVAMPPSSVAENSIVWRPAGVAPAILSTGLMKPMSSMRSASSSTSSSRREKSTLPWSMKSIRRPGVATRISSGDSSSLRCFGYGMPPSTVPVRTRGMNLLYFSTAVVTCSASSRVGVSTSTRGPRPGLAGCARRCNAGSTKAAVLPVPVGAEHIRSWPAIASGIAFACTGVGSV